VAINVRDEDIPLKLRYVYQVATRSDDRNTKNGVILVNKEWTVLSACNHMMAGYGDKDWHHERPFKYLVTEHAERAALYEAARKGIKTQGLTLVSNWVACPDCARGIVLAGIACVITHKQCQDKTPARWKEQVEMGLDIIRKDCDLVVWDGKVDKVDNLKNGEIWYP